ncbi:hypothetical protein HmCmsJML264_02351 [Escherichia coli]|nr:hypothetical protein HmCmsJML264_02351 [Escherichia coli]
MVVGAEIYLRQRAVVAQITIHATVLFAGADVNLVVRCVIDAIKVADLTAVRPATVRAVVGHGAAVAPRNAHAEVHSLIRIIVIFVAIAGHRDAHIANAPHIKIVGKHQVIVCLFRAIPVSTMGVVEIDRDTRCGKVLVIRDRIHLFVVSGPRHVRLARVQILAHSHKVLFGETVACKGDAAVKFVKVFGIAHAKGVAVQFSFAVCAVMIQVDVRVSHIERQRAKLCEVAPHPHRRRLVVLICQRATVKRPAICHPP